MLPQVETRYFVELERASSKFCRAIASRMVSHSSQFSMILLATFSLRSNTRAEGSDGLVVEGELERVEVVHGACLIGKVLVLRKVAAHLLNEKRVLVGWFAP